MLNLRNPFSAMTVSGSFLFCQPLNAFCSWPELPLSSDGSSDSACGIQSSVSIAGGIEDLLVVWQDETMTIERDISGTGNTPEGGILDPKSTPSCTTSWPQAWVSIAWGDPNCLAVWTDSETHVMASMGTSRFSE
jgi:hypothetical protein